MFFENRTNQIIDISELDLDKQAQSLKDCKIGTALKINNILYVNDQSQEGSIKEIAALLIKNDKYYQFESITIDWCNIKEIKKDIKNFREYKNIDFVEYYDINNKKAAAFNNVNANVWFSCACCGNSFKSTIEIQKIYDQDIGYGYCDECK